MKHFSARLCAALLVAACLPAAQLLSARADPAAPLHTHHRAPHHRVRMARAVMPVAAARPPPPPPAQAPAAVGPAPVPNEAVSAPIPPSLPAVSAAPSVFQLHYPPQGDGYVTGSSPQAMDDRNAAKATGVEVKVPLEQ
jgi:hypothetical protein